MSDDGPRREIVLASGNRAKLAELEPLLAEAGWRLMTQTAFGVDAADEPGATFVENALAKARHAALATGRAALADDSGLIVPALGGDPGVRSARFAGEDADDAANNARLLARMDGVADRRAMFCCVLVLLRRADDPMPIIAQGRWHGELLTAPRGDAGFGYDPLFRDPSLGLTAAELAPATKNERSHRGRAVRALEGHLHELDA
jgi:XTP/dITP diphosphohydrolase